MAGQRKIIVTANPDGSSKIEAQGFPDGSCLKETESLEQALGKVQGRELKAEAHKAAVGQTLKITQ
jgi:hypothetical protein